MWNLLGLRKPCSDSKNSALIGCRQTIPARGDHLIIPETLKPLGVSKTDNCEKLTTLLESYKMYHHEGEALQRMMLVGLEFASIVSWDC